MFLVAPSTTIRPITDISKRFPHIMGRPCATHTTACHAATAAARSARIAAASGLSVASAATHVRRADERRRAIRYMSTKNRRILHDYRAFDALYHGMRACRFTPRTDDSKLRTAIEKRSNRMMKLVRSGKPLTVSRTRKCVPCGGPEGIGTHPRTEDNSAADDCA